MENLTVYKIKIVTDKEGNHKEAIVDINNNTYTIHRAVVGERALLFNASAHSDKWISTSPVEDISFYENLLRIQTMNTIYKLEAVTKGE